MITLTRKGVTNIFVESFKNVSGNIPFSAIKIVTIIKLRIDKLKIPQYTHTHTLYVVYTYRKLLIIIYFTVLLIPQIRSSKCQVIWTDSAIYKISKLKEANGLIYTNLT